MLPKQDIFLRSMLVCCINILDQFVSAGLQRAPIVFATAMKNMTTDIGRNATFVCNVLKSETTGWKHNGELVYLRDLPMAGASSSRYSTEYSSHTGIHSLTITNASVEDDGSLECIAKWGSGDNDWATSAAYLNVLVPPSEVVIKTDSSVTSGGVVTVRMDEMVNLTCSAYEGRPFPKLAWFRNTRRLEGNIGYLVDEWTEKVAVHSSLRFKARPDDNDIEFTCHAESPALKKPLVRMKRINVLYPPISPIIRGVGDKIKVRAGDSDFRLDCTSEGGNPAPRLTWFRNNIQAESTDVATSGGEVTSILTFVPRITDNNAVLTCEAVNQLMPRGLSVQTSLIVQFGPAFASLKGPSETKLGDRLEMNCTSGPSNPPAEITWTVNNRPYPDKSVHYQPTAEGAYVTTSKMVVPVRTHEHVNALSVACQAVNPEINEVTRTTSIVQVFPKTNPGHAPPPRKFIFNGGQPNDLLSSNETDMLAGPTGMRPDNFTMVVAISASVGVTVFFTLLGSLIYVVIRGRAKKFEEMANSDSSASTRGQTEITSQTGVDTATDTTGSDSEKTPVGNRGSSKTTPSPVRADISGLHLLDQDGSVPYETYRGWHAPQPGNVCYQNDLDGAKNKDNIYVDTLLERPNLTLQRNIMQHTPSPVRPVLTHLPPPIRKTAMLSTFNGHAIPVYRAKTLLEEMKGHLV